MKGGRGKVASTSRRKTSKRRAKSKGARPSKAQPTKAPTQPAESPEERIARRVARVQAEKEAKQRSREMRKRLLDKSRPLDVEVPKGASAFNGTCEWKTTEEERQARQEACAEHLGILGHLWPVFWGRLAGIPDWRNPRKIKHLQSVLMLYGVMMFVLQMSSRREANAEMTKPQVLENLRLWFPEIEQLPHQDTLAGLLAASEPEAVEEALVGAVRELIRKKKFERYLIEGCYPVCMDGTQKFKRDGLKNPEMLTRTVQRQDGTQEQHYVYVLEVSLGFRNGMTIPLLSEFLTYSVENETKQDCEQRAFHRAAERLKKLFPKLPILLLLDGLYPNGPVIERCRKNHWQFMTVLPDASLPSVWDEYRGLRKITRGNTWCTVWQGRHQKFTWINEITYFYGENGRRRQTLHVVECEESWQVSDEAGNPVTKTARHVWISSEPLSAKNVHERCNLGARHRWNIEEGILAEKWHGYSYEHCFSEDWNALRCYHYLMRIGHLINVLVWYSARLTRGMRRLGIRGFLALVWTTLLGPWFDADWVRCEIARPRQLRLV